MKATKKQIPFNPKVFLSKGGEGRTISKYAKGQIIYQQGDPANSVFYVQTGKVTKTLLSEQGKEAVVAVFGAGGFFRRTVFGRTGTPLR